MAKKKKRSKNTGKSFENLTETVTKIFASDDSTVEKNVFIDTEFGKRQFDVMLTRSVPPFGNVKIAVEARDHQRKGSVTQLDAFKSKLDDCSAAVQKGIIINRKGFTENAKKKAKRNGIQLYRLEDRSDQILDSAFSLPVVIQEHRVGHVLFHGTFYNKEEVQLTEQSILLNGMPLNQFCLDAMHKKRNKLTKATRIVEKVTELVMSNSKFLPLDVTVAMDIITRNHFGYLNELPNSIILKGQTGEEDRAIIDSAEIMGKSTFREWPNFWMLDDAPNHLGVIKCGSIRSSVQDGFAAAVFNNYRNSVE